MFSFVRAYERSSMSEIFYIKINWSTTTINTTIYTRGNRHAKENVTCESGRSSRVLLATKTRKLNIENSDRVFQWLPKFQAHTIFNSNN